MAPFIDYILNEKATHTAFSHPFGMSSEQPARRMFLFLVIDFFHSVVANLQATGRAHGCLVIKITPFRKAKEGADETF